MLPGGTRAITDIIGAHHALALRLEREFETWIAREGNKAPPAATALAKLAKSSASHMRQAQEALDLKSRSGADLDEADFLGVAAKTTAIEEIHSLLEHVSYTSLHPVLGPTVRAELESLKIEGQILVAGTRQNVSYELATYESENFRGLVDDDLIAQTAWPINIFLIPNRPVAWALHHVLLYHEIGHAVTAELPDFDPPSDLQPLSDAADMFKQIERGEEISVYSECMMNWAHEALADAIGVLLAGPAYAFAFSRFTASHFGLATATPSHLPTALRILLICKVLERAGILGSLKAPLSQLLEQWISISKKVNDSGTYETADGDERFARVVTLLLRDIELVHDGLVDHALRVVGSKVYLPQYYEDDHVRAAELHLHKIPPIESALVPTLDAAGEPLAPARIFNVVWAAYLMDLEMPADMASLSSRSDYYSESLLGALEGADALRAWRAVP